jgi:hypothetical protein
VRGFREPVNLRNQETFPAMLDPLDPLPTIRRLDFADRSRIRCVSP